MNLIGLSLSLCVKDICEGKVSIKNVILIITGTSAKTDNDWNNVLELYSKLYWKKYPKKAVNVCNALFNEGRILQSTRQYSCYTNKGHWARKITLPS